MAIFVRSIFILSLLLSGGISKSLAQDSLLSRKSMLIDSVKKRGIYRTFTEFQQNNPSYTDTFFVKEAKWTHKYSVLQTINRDGKIKNVSGDIWGYCDGQEVYIRSSDYSKLTDFGYFCIFKGTGFTIMPIYWATGLKPGVGKYGKMHHGSGSFETTDTFVLDYTTGAQRVLKKANLVTYVLSKDPALLEQFREDENGKELILEYVHKFNLRNTSKLL